MASRGGNGSAQMSKDKRMTSPSGRPQVNKAAERRKSPNPSSTRGTEVQKNVDNKNVPSYLRPTVSSRIDPSSRNNNLPKKQKSHSSSGGTIDVGNKQSASLNRRRSFDKPPSSSQPHPTRQANGSSAEKRGIRTSLSFSARGSTKAHSDKFPSPSTKHNARPGNNNGKKENLIVTTAVNGKKPNTPVSPDLSTTLKADDSAPLNSTSDVELSLEEDQESPLPLHMVHAEHDNDDKSEASELEMLQPSSHTVHAELDNDDKSEASELEMLQTSEERKEEEEEGAHVQKYLVQSHEEAVHEFKDGSTGPEIKKLHEQEPATVPENEDAASEQTGLDSQVEKILVPAGDMDENIHEHQGADDDGECRNIASTGERVDDKPKLDIDDENKSATERQEEKKPVVEEVNEHTINRDIGNHQGDKETDEKATSRGPSSRSEGEDDTSAKAFKVEAETKCINANIGKKPKDSNSSPSVAYNDVIEETANKLREQRKNRVRALVGAFETVISLESED